MDFNQERRGLFDGLKVPFDVNAILLAAAAVVVFLMGLQGIETVLPGDSEKAPLLAGMLGTVIGKLPGNLGARIEDLLGLEHLRPSYSPMAWILVFAWVSVIWAFSSAAICRIAAMKIAREEGLELKDAVKFAISKFIPNLLSIAFVIAIVGFFYVLCNATIAGWIGRIPYVGDILVAILFFLVLLSSFFVVFAGVLGILGFNLASAAIATEASDTFDGVSRAWNYILARPWQVILTYSLTLAYVGIFLFCGALFEKVAVKSLSIGGWGMGHNPRIIEADDSLARDLGVEPKQRLAIPGKAEFLYRRLVLKDPNFNDKDTTFGKSDAKDRLFYPQVEADGITAIKDVKTNEALGQKHAGDPDRRYVDVWPALEGTLKFASGMVWLWLLLAKLLIYAYAVSYFYSAMTTIYFLLRKDVEGDDYTEVNLEDEEDDETFEDHAPAAAAKPEEKKALPIITPAAPPPPTGKDLPKA